MASLRAEQPREHLRLHVLPVLDPVPGRWVQPMGVFTHEPHPRPDARSYEPAVEPEPRARCAPHPATDGRREEKAGPAEASVQPQAAAPR